MNDRQKMVSYICSRIPSEGTRVILTTEGSDGPAIFADLTPSYDADLGWELQIESNEPEWTTLKEVYEYFRHLDMTHEEWWKELTWVDPVKDFPRKYDLLTPTEQEIFDAASDTVPIRGEALLAATKRAYTGQAKYIPTLLVKMGLFAKVKKGYLRRRPPQYPNQYD